LGDVVNVGLVGLGTVGRGVYQLLTRENKEIAERLGAELRIKRILVQNPRKERGISVPSELLTTDHHVVLEDDEIDIIIEVVGGTDIARQLVMGAIAAGKSVVTANKELMANHGQEVLEAARERGVDVLFEASVGGGIPIIRPLKDSLIGNRVTRVMGIVNGTTNFILSRMETGVDYQAALEEAQALGYAERDPSSDVEGKDAAAKISILASIAFNSRVSGADVNVEGITKVTAQDIMYAREFGYAVKLLALAKIDDDCLDVRVHPTMIPLTHPLASVKDAYNAIFVEGDAVGELMFFGQGAGSLPTASSVMADVFAAANNCLHHTSGRSVCTCFNDYEIKSADKIETAYYLLIECADHPGVLAQIAQAFGNHHVSLGSVIQKRTVDGLAEVVFMTHMVKEGNLKAAIDEVGALESVVKIRNVIRVEGAKE
jgi:homoserine dehydrogenase